MPRQNAPSKARRNSPPPVGTTILRRPALTVTNRQRAHRLDLARIRRLIDLALPLCLEEAAGPLPALLGTLPEVTAAIVSPRAMARVHVDFLGLAGPTDVITFDYGEILVCAAVAAENAALYHQSLDDELALYLIHGLLHLQGYDDLTPAHARQMRARQAKILNAVRKSA